MTPGTDEWVKFNPLTQTYDTPDGTTVPVEMLSPPITLMDVIAVAILRDRQRKQVTERKTSYDHRRSTENT